MVEYSIAGAGPSDHVRQDAMTAAAVLQQGGAQPSLAAKVRHLKRPDSYPDGVARVETIETHMSWVFLTERHAYKLKKPVRYDFLDFSTLAARRRDCEAEVYLNRRLAPNVYLGTVPLTDSDGGGLALHGSGRVVDWLVQMRRLPRDRMLDRMIREGTLRESEIRAAAAVLSRFFLAAAPVRTDIAGYRARLAADIRDNERALVQPDGGLPADEVRCLTAAQARFLQRDGLLLDRRVASGRLIEGHGDLRAEHICLEATPVVIDCLEFKRDFRILDPADELAFLAIDCERHGASWIRALLFDVYGDVTGDQPPEALINFYSSYRALLRAKIALWHLHEPDVRSPAKWRRLALDYLRLGQRYAGRSNDFVQIDD